MTLAVPHHSLSLLTTLFLLFCPTGLALLLFLQLLPNPELEAGPIGVFFASTCLYVTAHGFRAVRLATIAGPLLGLSGRSSCLLHIVTVPGAMALPFKLGELVRLHQLFVLARNFPASLTVILIERFLDGLMLLVFLIIFQNTSTADASSMFWLFLLTVTAVLLTTTILVLGSQALTAVQRYIITHHRKTASVKQLSKIDNLRDMTSQATDLLKAQGLLLVVMSAFIWLFELAAFAFLVTALSDMAFFDSGGLLIARLLGGAVAQSGSTGAEIQSLSQVLIMGAMLAVWVPAVYFYLRRMGHEPIRRRLAIRRKKG